MLKACLLRLHHQELPSKYEAVLQFYPGQDRNNSTGSATAEDIAQNYAHLEQELKRWETPLPFYVYKHAQGLERWNKNRKWQQDPDQFFEKTFFSFHYAGGSYVVIDDKGRFRAYFGEFSTKGLLKTVRQVKRQNASTN